MKMSKEIQNMSFGEKKKVIGKKLIRGKTYSDIKEETGMSIYAIKSIVRYFDLYDAKDTEQLPYEHIALFSGGNDSMVSTHYTMEKGPGELVLHIDTTIGIDETQQFVKDVCDKYNWELKIISGKRSFKEFVKEYGFPKPGNHNYVYRYLKEHAIGSFVSDCYFTPTMYTGVWKGESERRKMNVSEGLSDDERWYWSAPMKNWASEQIEDYREKHNLPINDVAKNIDMSGECLCGAYFDRITELEKLKEHYPEAYNELKELEELAMKHHGNTKYSYWGSEGLTDVNEQIPEIEEFEMKLCSDCERK